MDAEPTAAAIVPDGELSPPRANGGHRRAAAHHDPAAEGAEAGGPDPAGDGTADEAGGPDPAGDGTADEAGGPGTAGGGTAGATSGEGVAADPAGTATTAGGGTAGAMAGAAATVGEATTPAPSSPSVSEILRSAYPRFTGLSKPAMVALVAGVGVAILALLASGTLTIFLIGILIVYMIDPVIGWMHRHGVPRWLATVIMIAAIVLGFIGLCLLIAHVMVTEGASFVAQLPAWIDQFQSRIAASDLPDGIKVPVANLGDTLQGGMTGVDWTGVVTTGLQTAFGLLGIMFSLTVIPFFVFFVAKDRPALTKAGRNMIPEPWRADTEHVGHIALSDLGLYIRAQLVIVAVVATLIFLGLEAIAFTVEPKIGQFALFLAVFAGFMELIPNFGPYLGMIPAVVVALSISPTCVLLVVILYVAVAFLEGQVLVPIIQGKGTSLHPGWIMLLILSGMAIWGVLGAIIAVPVAITARDVYRYVFRRAAGATPTQAIESARER